MAKVLIQFDTNEPSALAVVTIDGELVPVTSVVASLSLKDKPVLLLGYGIDIGVKAISEAFELNENGEPVGQDTVHTELLSNIDSHLNPGGGTQ